MPQIATAAPERCVCECEWCVCPDEERALRMWMDAIPGTPDMSPEQREEALGEIDKVEGYRRSDYESASDATLARGVLEAWTDYCRDKGLL